jgi:hypothetical protein
MTCEELREKVRKFNDDKANWYRKQTGFSKMKKNELIALCEKCDEATKIKRRRQLISYKDMFEYILNEDKKLLKRLKYDTNYDEEDFIEIEYEWNNFANHSPCESAVSFIVPYDEDDGPTKSACLNRVYNTSSPFALWMCNFDDNESDDEKDDDEDEDDDDDDDDDIDEDLLWHINLMKGDENSKLMKDAMKLYPDNREACINYISAKSLGTFNGLVSN